MMFDAERAKIGCMRGRAAEKGIERSPKPTCLRFAQGRTPNPTRQMPGWQKLIGGRRASAGARDVSEESVSSEFKSEETVSGLRLFLLGDGLLRGRGLLLLLVGGVHLRLFLGGLLLVRFRGSIAHNFVFFCGLVRLRHVGFSEGRSTMLAGSVLVNDGRSFTRAGDYRDSRITK